MILDIRENELTPEQFILLREEKYFKKYSDSDVAISLNNTLYSVLVLHQLKPVAMGRIIGDDRIAFFIKDVVVHPDYQDEGIGKLVMDKLLNYIKIKGCEDAYIGLMSTPGKEFFYEKFGFIKRPNNHHGHGMIKFLKEENEL